MREDDDVLFDIKSHQKKSRTTMESVINRKDLSWEDLDMMFNDLN